MEKDVYEEYKAAKTERVGGLYDVSYAKDVKSWIDGKTHETFNGDRETYSRGTVKEEIGGKCEQIFHGEVSRTHDSNVQENITGTSDHKASGNITITSTGGAITVTSPTEVTLNSPKWHKVTTHHLDLFGLKLAAGNVKGDYSGIKVSVNSFKYDGTQVALSHAGMAMSRTGFKLDTANGRYQQIGFEFKDEQIAVTTGAMAIIMKGFVKVG